MPIRFQRRFQVFPGLRVNINKNSISTTIGGRGFGITTGSRGARLHAGIPGTGLSYNTQLFSNAKSHSSSGSRRTHRSELVEDTPPETFDEQNYGSEDLDNLTSVDMAQVKELIEKVIREEVSLQNDLVNMRQEQSKTENARALSRLLLYGFLPSVAQRYADHLAEQKTAIDQLNEALEHCSINLEVEHDSESKAAYDRLTHAFMQLARSGIIWDVKGSYKTQEFKTAVMHLNREEVPFGQHTFSAISETVPALYMRNANGADLYLYPNFLVLRSGDDIAVLDLKELKIHGEVAQYPERESLPPGAQVVGTTWEKLNKDGTPDKRYRDNRSFPVAAYYLFSIGADHGLSEVYLCVDVDAGKAFIDALCAYQAML